MKKYRSPEEIEFSIEIKKIISSTILPCILLSVMLLFKLLEELLNVNLFQMGVLPRQAIGLFGVITSPLVHGSWGHLLSNSLPFVILASLLIYFHPKKWFELIVALWLTSGFWLWIFGRSVYHIGVSGVIYSLAGFLVAYGIAFGQKEKLAVSGLVLLFYGSMIWYIFPVIENMSWEAHLTGLFGGIALGIYYSFSDKKEIVSRRGNVNISFDTLEGKEIQLIYHFEKDSSKN